MLRPLIHGLRARKNQRLKFSDHDVIKSTIGLAVRRHKRVEATVHEPMDVFNKPDVGSCAGCKAEAGSSP